MAQPATSSCTPQSKQMVEKVLTRMRSVVSRLSLQALLFVCSYEVNMSHRRSDMHRISRGRIIMAARLQALKGMPAEQGQSRMETIVSAHCESLGIMTNIIFNDVGKEISHLPPQDYCILLSLSPPSPMENPKPLQLLCPPPRRPFVPCSRSKIPWRTSW